MVEGTKLIKIKLYAVKYAHNTISLEKLTIFLENDNNLKKFKEIKEYTFLKKMLGMTSLI